MKTVSLLTMLMAAVCLVGCENAELVSCQQEKDILQSQLDQANAANTEKDSRIEALKTERVEMETKAMESIRTMLTKQAEKDEELKQKLAESRSQCKDLKAQNRIQNQRIETLETEHENLKGLYEKAVQSLEIANKEKQELIQKMNRAEEKPAQ